MFFFVDIEKIFFILENMKIKTALNFIINLIDAGSEITVSKYKLSKQNGAYYANDIKMPKGVFALFLKGLFFEKNFLEEFLKSLFFENRKKENKSTTQQ